MRRWETEGTPSGRNDVRLMHSLAENLKNISYKDSGPGFEKRRNEKREGDRRKLLVMKAVNVRCGQSSFC